MRIKDVILGLMSLALIGGGATLVAAFFLGPGAPDESSGEPRDFNVPVLEETQPMVRTKEKTQSARASEDETLYITIPKMDRVTDAAVPVAEGNDEEKLRDYTAIHLQGTGHPWEPGANVYIAGHRLGYPGYPSFLAFYDLDNLEDGDRIFVGDAEGRQYVYEVTRSFVVGPTDLSITEPVEGRDILTLQTCTLPDYSQRLVVQAEKVA